MQNIENNNKCFIIACEMCEMKMAPECAPGPIVHLVPLAQKTCGNEILFYKHVLFLWKVRRREGLKRRLSGISSDRLLLFLDVNGDGEVNVADISTVIDIILSK